jgi:seryl-tRNA synthetase
MENGQCSLSGDLLELERRLEGVFLSWAAGERAAEHRFPTFLPARELGKLDYFRSFAHLVTFPVALDPDQANLEAFARGEPLSAGGEIRLARPAPIRDVLTPAACYHFYVAFQGETLAAPRHVTTRATCFRREAYYKALERQWSFSMREIVCIGTMDEVKAFLGRREAAAEAFWKRLDLPVAWATATDPFFNPSKNPKYLAQKLDPVKREMVFQDRLAIGSSNFHRNYFGEAFEIRRAGEDAFSGCIAFGIERWIYAILARFGPDRRGWPEIFAMEKG